MFHGVPPNLLLLPVFAGYIILVTFLGKRSDARVVSHRSFTAEVHSGPGSKNAPHYWGDNRNRKSAA